MTSEHVFTGRIEGGRLKVGLRVLQALHAVLRHWRDCPVVITVEKLYATRSLASNALYWVGYVNPLAEATGNSPKWMHEYLKKRFLPSRRQHLVIQNRHGEIIDEADFDHFTTTTLNKAEFSEYLNEIEGFALEIGVDVGPRQEHAA